ncbi:MAG: purine-nucleoside phosphorylase [Oscillospiraceae bacterium]|nr:purine-nucleoside phosphorylase [Oscillospiraceae bacterium]
MEKLVSCRDQLRRRTDFTPRVALVLGSGLGGYAAQIEQEAAVPYAELDGFPVSTVAGHTGRFVFGRVKGVPVVAMEGRVHLYEGYDPADVVLPIRLMGLLGAKALLLTNAAGGVNFDFQPGDLMLITDHISTFVPSPLRGANLDTLGPRFPDMSAVYDRELCGLIRTSAKKLGVPLREGVYMQFPGPAYETPAEIRMARALGADAVGMSTACEALAARHMGLRTAGVSCITNLASGMLDRPLSHEEVQQTADAVAARFTALVTDVISAMGEIQ